MRFLTAVGGEGGIGQLDALEQKVLAANPILEAFGNAKTLRNNNSSRFGKFTEMHFSFAAQGQPAVSGAVIETYLLEKSRLVSHVAGERGFHVFYQLLAGKPAGVPLDSAAAYTYLAGGSDTAIPGVDDAAEFKTLTDAMASLGFSAAEVSGCWSILAGLLALGNVTFAGADGGAASLDKSAAVAVAGASGSLGLADRALQERLMNRSIKAGAEESVVVALPADEAANARDALAKYVYGKLFDWLVARINQSVPGTGADAFIGILDISGFEIFEENSFEQFCINFANEKIQFYFNWQILKQEQEIYELEGLRYRQVDYEDNAPLIELIEDKRSGVFALLDEACLMPRGDDTSFTIKVHTTHSANDYLSKPKHSRSAKKRLLDQECFVINHFAGDVCYETARFLAKNNDTIHDELIALLTTSSVPFVKGLFPAAKAEVVAYGPTGGRFKSVSSTFRTQLTSLMDTLNATNSHFIRCIKPNADQSPRSFDSNSVMTQLQYSGMCAALLLMQAGFPTRISFGELHSRYAPKMPPMLQKLKPNIFCEALLVALDLDGGKDFQMGLTKVFFRPGKLAIMDQLTMNTPENVEVIVAKVRKWLARKRFYAAAHAVAAVNRMGKIIQGIRAFRRFRQAANVMLRVARFARPVLRSVRKRIYSEEVVRKRKAEEAERQRLELETKLKREAEEEAKRQAELARIQKDEEEKQRRIEEEKRKQAEALKALEGRIAELSEANAGLTVKLAAAVDTSTKTATALETELTETKSTLGGKVAGLDEALKSEQRKSEQQQETVAQLTATNSDNDARLQELAALVDSLQTRLAAEEQSSAELRDELRAERHGHEDDNHSSAVELADLRRKYKMEVGVKDAVTASLKFDKSNLTGKLKAAGERFVKTTDGYKTQVEKLQDDLDVAAADQSMLTDQKTRLQTDLNSEVAEKETLQRERTNLIDVAVRCQEFQQKLRNIYTKLKKDSDLISLIYGDQSYETMIRHNTKAGAIMKQGGSNVQKWQTRFLVLVDCFLLYYANKKDKSPKGVIRMYQAIPDKVDLSGISKDFGITVIDKVDGHEYFFSATDEAEQTAWVENLTKAGKSA